MLHVYIAEPSTQHIRIHPDYIHMLVLSHILDINQAQSLKGFFGDVVFPIHVIQEVSECLIILSRIQSLHTHIHTLLAHDYTLPVALAYMIDTAWKNKLNTLRSHVMRLHTHNGVDAAPGYVCVRSDGDVQCNYESSGVSSIDALSSIHAILRTIHAFYNGIHQLPYTTYTHTILASITYVQTYGQHDFICYAPYFVPIMVPISRLILAWKRNR
ncbi:hypothetical protein EON63_10800 [archaeon]|nr:MAG: hypothetical protein EON63_10800 [archaeon]